MNHLAKLFARRPKSEENRETFDVFLSHNSDDKVMVIELARCLKDRGLSAWLDVLELRPGLSWLEGVEKGLSSSGSCAVLIGKSGLGAWHRKEMQAALLSQGPEYPVIPVLLPGAPDQCEVSTFLSLMTWVDLRDGADEPPHAPVSSRSGSDHYAIHDPKNGDLLIGRQELRGPARPMNGCSFIAGPGTTRRSNLPHNQKQTTKVSGKPVSPYPLPSTLARMSCTQPAHCGVLHPRESQSITATTRRSGGHVKTAPRRQTRSRLFVSFIQRSSKPQSYTNVK